MGASELAPLPERGRRFEATRQVRIGDADRHGRLRLDALARMLQDVGSDDMVDAGLVATEPFIARRSMVWAPVWPRLGDRMTFTTWCGGIGSRWAERRTSVRAGEGRMEVASLWVHVDSSGRPIRLPDWFKATYGESAAGRHVTARLSHPPPPFALSARPWLVRSTDLDVLGHVNNAATWAAVEDEAARRGCVPETTELEYHGALDEGEPVHLSSVRAADGSLQLWLSAAGIIKASAVLSGCQSP